LEIVCYKLIVIARRGRRCNDWVRWRVYNSYWSDRRHPGLSKTTKQDCLPERRRL